MRTIGMSMLLLAALLLGACGVGVQLDRTAGNAGAETAALSEADIRATVEAEFQATAAARSALAEPAVSAAPQLSEADIRATVEAEYQATAQAAASAAPQLSEADIRATVEAEYQATAQAQARASSAPAASGGAAETVPTPSAAPEAQPVAQAEVPPAMLLLLDSSGSMLLDAGDGRDKITAAKEALKSLVDALPDGAPVGLRVYGHRFPNTDKANGCQDTELVQPIAALDKNAMKGRIDSFGAQGYTPIALTLEQGYNDLPPEGARTMVLVSDGEETCDRDPCQVARDLEAKGVELVVETVGFQVDDKTRAQLQCIAEATGGQYRDAANAAELADRLKEISNRALREYQQVGNELAGGGDFRNATPVQPGEYIEKIQGGEIVYYRVDVPEGKELIVTATYLPQGAFDAYFNIRLSAYNEQRQDSGNDNVGVFELLNKGEPQSTSLTESYWPSVYITLAAEPNTPESEATMRGRDLPVELIFELVDES